MEFQSREVIDRFKEKIPHIEKDAYGRNLYGMTHLDIICEDNSIKQYVLAFERFKVIEPPEFLKLIYADVYIRIKDETLYKIAIKEIPLDDALSQKLFKVHGDKEIWQMQLKVLREILPNEHFSQHSNKSELIQEAIEDEYEDEMRKERERDEEWHRRTDLSTIPPELKFLADALEELHKRM